MGLNLHHTTKYPDTLASYILNFTFLVLKVSITIISTSTRSTECLIIIRRKISIFFSLKTETEGLKATELHT